MSRKRDSASMASANVELVRSIYAAWERGDYASVEWADPQMDLVWADGPTPGRWTGLAELREVWRDFLGAWQELRVEADEYRELDDERVLVLVRYSGRGKASGVDIDRRMRARAANLLHVRGGKVTRLVVYYDSERALADLGLAPEAGSPDTGH
jgi:ketosteroid isomerase-like protein